MNDSIEVNSTDIRILDPKLKGFMIFKLIMSAIYFVPAFFIFTFVLAMDIIFLVFGAGYSKIGDASGLAEIMDQMSILAVVPSILVVILFIITFVFTIRFFMNKYNKKIDLFICIMFLLINVFLILFSWLISIIFTILLFACSVVLIKNIVYITKVNSKINETKVGT